MKSNSFPAVWAANGLEVRFIVKVLGLGLGLGFGFEMGFGLIWIRFGI